MPLDIEDREIGGDHPRLREPVSSPTVHRRGGRGRLPLRGKDAAPQRCEGQDRGKNRKTQFPQGGHEAPSLEMVSATHTLGRTASLTVIFAFFFKSSMYASTTFFPFSFSRAVRIRSLSMATMPTGIFFPSRAIVAECSA